jgi:hypothetical protein
MCYCVRKRIKLRVEQLLQEKSKMHDNTRYPAILFISKVIRFFAWCSIAFTAIAMIILLGKIGDGFSSFLAFIGAGVVGGFLALALFAIAESLIVLIDIEYNTRKNLVEKNGSDKSIVENNFKPPNIGVNKLVENKPKNNENIDSISHAIAYLKTKEIHVKIRDGKYSIFVNGETIYFYKDSELIEYASTIF